MKATLDVIVLPVGDEDRRGFRFPRIPLRKLRVPITRLLALLKRLLAALLRRLLALLRKLPALRKELPALRKKLRVHRRLAFACLCLAGMYLGAIVLADPLLAVRSERKPSDVIVVLGGDGPPRADLGAALFLAGLAPKVLVSGDGDCTYIALNMTRQGVDPAAIGLECSSGTTEENALFSKPILNTMNVRRAIVVTSWYHSRRAIETFEAVMPSVQWLSVPTENAHSFWQIAQNLQIAKEYPKTVIYALRRLLGQTTDRSRMGTDINLATRAAR